MAYQMPGLRQHAFHHDLGFMPISMQAGMHEICAGASACTVAGNDLGDHGCKFIDTLHGNLVKAAARPRCGQPAKWDYVPHRNCALVEAVRGASSGAEMRGCRAPGRKQARSSAPAGIARQSHRLRSPLPPQSPCRPASSLFVTLENVPIALAVGGGGELPRIPAAVVAGQRPGARQLGVKERRQAAPPFPQRPS